MIAKVQLWGRTIGAVSLDEGREVAAFQYDADFARSGIELSPLVMPPSAPNQPVMRRRRCGGQRQGRCWRRR